MNTLRRGRIKLRNNACGLESRLCDRLPVGCCGEGLMYIFLPVWVKITLVYLKKSYIEHCKHLEQLNIVGPEEIDSYAPFLQNMDTNA